MAELICPRPLRISSQRPIPSPVARLMSPAIDSLARMRLSDADPPTDADAPSSAGRSSSSPRLGLPQDALDEFLSILRPSLFSQNPPAFRVLRNDPGSGLVVPVAQNFRAQERSHSRSPSASSQLPEDGFLTITRGASSPVYGTIMQDDETQLSGRMWRLPGILESPVSRIHTRNPFQRHPSYEVPMLNGRRTPVSPLFLPLPPSPIPSDLTPLQDESSTDPQPSND